MFEICKTIYKNLIIATSEHRTGDSEMGAKILSLTENYLAVARWPLVGENGPQIQKYVAWDGSLLYKIE